LLKFQHCLFFRFLTSAIASHPAQMRQRALARPPGYAHPAPCHLARADEVIE
jgi:hypothetical protein